MQDAEWILVPKSEPKVAMDRLEINTREKLTLVMPVVPLMEEEGISEDPLMDLMTEFSAYESEGPTEEVMLTPPMVHEGLREGEAWVALGRQLDGLRDGLQRLHFYLSDVDDNLRR